MLCEAADIDARRGRSGRRVPAPSASGAAGTGGCRPKCWPCGASRAAEASSASRARLRRPRRAKRVREGRRADGRAGPETAQGPSASRRAAPSAARADGEAETQAGEPVGLAEGAQDERRRRQIRHEARSGVKSAKASSTTRRPPRAAQRSATARRVQAGGTMRPSGLFGLTTNDDRGVAVSAGDAAAVEPSSPGLAPGEGVFGIGRAEHRDGPGRRETRQELDQDLRARARRRSPRRPAPGRRSRAAARRAASSSRAGQARPERLTGGPEADRGSD